MKRLYPFLLFLTALCYSSCQNDTKVKLPPEVEKENFVLKINRFDNDLFALKNNKDMVITDTIAMKYPDFFFLFTKKIINIGDSSNPQMTRLLNDFIHDKYIKEMYDEVQKQYSRVDDFNQQLTNAFKTFHYLFPQAKIPEITYFVSGYNYSTITTNNTLGIGLEMYLGSNYSPYSLMDFPLYRQKLMRKEYIVPDALQAWVSTEFEKDEDYSSLLHQMIFKGKVLYTVKNLMPNTPDTLLLGYTEAQQQWCNKNEAQIWSALIEKNVLFSQLNAGNSKYVNEGPFTPGFPRESPGKIGVWVGYKIIKAYMDKQKDISLVSLFNNRNAQEILAQSKYKPKS